MIKEQEIKNYSRFYKHITSWSAVMSTFVFLIVAVVVKDTGFYGSN